MHIFTDKKWNLEQVWDKIKEEQLQKKNWQR